jgi:serine/threonine protein kinase
MAKLYGGRWERIDSNELGHGGQGRVFRVRDVSGQYPDEAALKRVLDVARRERFRREIEAIKRLTDPSTQQTHRNVISLIDHSALDESDNPDKQYLVMPIAHGGDLGAPGRLALYKDSLDGVLQVSKQVAHALRAAHEQKIVHRDVKPANILFTGNGHDLWLSDFGICLIRETPRITESPEVMGPRAFMAPELEQGGQLDVSPSVDLYSLWKVIFYMLSGGVILPRERLHEPQYLKVFDKSERYSLMEILLRQLICDERDRLQSADEVLNQLDKIERWEQNARVLPIGNAALSGLEKLQRRSLEAGRITAENSAARTQQNQTLGTVQTSLTNWLLAELRKLVPLIASTTIKCQVAEAGIPTGQEFRVQTGPRSMYTALNGVEITIEDVNDQRGRIYTLQFFLCRHQKIVVTVTSGDRNELSEAEPVRDIELAVLPFYRQTLRHAHPQHAYGAGYISQKKNIGTNRGHLQLPQRGTQNRSPQVSYSRVEAVAASFERDVSLYTEFRASEWPGNEEKIREMLKEAIDAFIDIANQ